MVPGRTRLVGGVMAGGVGLAIASADVDGEALTTPGPGREQAPSVRARKALSATPPLNAAVISRTSPERGYCHGQNQRPNSTTAVPARRIGFMLSPLPVTLDRQPLGPP